MSDAPPPPHPPFPQQPPPAQPTPPSTAPPPGFPSAPAYGAPAGSAGPVDTAAIRPKARWYWIGGAIMVLGFAAAIAFGAVGFFGISNTVDDFARVSPGSETVDIDSRGRRVIYTEGGSFFASVEVVAPSGERVTTSRYLTDLEYDFNGDSGRAFATFDAAETGRYTVTTDTDIAIGESIAGDLVRTIVIPLIIIAVTSLIGLVVIIVTAVKRSGSKKRLAHSG